MEEDYFDEKFNIAKDILKKYRPDFKINENVEFFYQDLNKVYIIDNRDSFTLFGGINAKGDNTTFMFIKSKRSIFHYINDNEAYLLRYTYTILNNREIQVINITLTKIIFNNRDNLFELLLDF